MNEKKIVISDLVMEVGAALKEYFVATVSCENEVLLLKFTNGQTFALTITERN